MRLINLFKDLKRLKPYRKDYYIEPKIKLLTDISLISLLPTIIWVPWIYRYPNCYVVEIMFLNFDIGIGLWKHHNEVNGGKNK